MALNIDSFSLSPNPATEGDTVSAVASVSGAVGGTYDFLNYDPFTLDTNVTFNILTGSTATFVNTGSASSEGAYSIGAPFDQYNWYFDIEFTINSSSELSGSSIGFGLKFYDSDGSLLQLLFLRARKDTNKMESFKSSVGSYYGGEVSYDTLIGSLLRFRVYRDDSTIFVECYQESVLKNIIQYLGSESSIGDVDEMGFYISGYRPQNVSVSNFDCGYATDVTYEVKKDDVIIDTQTTTDTTATYSFPASLSDDGASYSVDVTNAGTTVSSPPVLLTVNEFGTGDLEQGETSTAIELQYGYKTTIDLSMERSIDARGIVNWLDNGSEYDNFTTTFSVNSEDGQTLENLLAGDSTEALNLTTNVDNYPFSMLFAVQDIPVVVSKWGVGGDTNILGVQRSYEFEMTPDVTDVYSSLTQSGVIPDCGNLIQHWQVNTTYFPWGKWEQSINDFRRVNQYAGSVGQVVDTTRDYGDSFTVTVNCAEEQARLIIDYLALHLRGTEQTITFPASYNPFGRRYEGITSCKVKLFNSILEIVHNNYNNVDITFSLQMTGV